MDDDIVQSS